MDNLIKLTLAILFFVCLLDIPYGYFQMVRLVAFMGFGILAFQGYQENKKVAMLIYFALALLFQPFFKIALGREIWNIVDIITGIVLLTSLFIKDKE